MLTITKHFANGLSLAVEGTDIKEAIENLSASCGTEFLKESCCGVCKCPDIAPIHRSVESTEKGKKKGTYNYYEMKCMKPGCWAVLELGILQEKPGLFPKRKDADGNPLPNGGWVKKEYKKKEDD